MSKSKEELNKIKEEVEAVNEKLQELSKEEIAQVTGGLARDISPRLCSRHLQSKASDD